METEPTAKVGPHVQGGLRPTAAAQNRLAPSVIPDCGECWSLFDPTRDHLVEAEVVDAVLLRHLAGAAWPRPPVPPVQVVVAGIDRPMAHGATAHYRAEVLAYDASWRRVDEYAAELAYAAAQFLTGSEADQVRSWLEANWDGAVENVVAIRQHGVQLDPFPAMRSFCIALAECGGDALGFPAAAVLVGDAEALDWADGSTAAWDESTLPFSKAVTGEDEEEGQ